MNKKVLSFVNKLEGWKTAIKSLHWDSNSLSQHELCDKIADTIAEFQDTVSEVEQSITGNLSKGELKPEPYKVTSLKKFVEDVLDATNTFYKDIEDEGDSYTGMRSDCESFLSDMQRNLYLVNFTMKEDLKRSIAKKLNQGYRNEENIKTTFHGIKPSTEKGVLKRINDLTKNGQLNTRVFNGINDVLDFYRKILGNVGRLRCIDACAENNYIVKMETESGWVYYGLLRVKDVNEGQCKASITFSPHGDEPEVVEPNPEPEGMPIEDGNNLELGGDTGKYDMEAAKLSTQRWFNNGKGKVEENRIYEIYGEGYAYRMTGSEFHDIIKESVKNILEANGSGMDDKAWRDLDNLRFKRAMKFADMRDKVKGQNVSGQMSGLKNQIVNRLNQQGKYNAHQSVRNDRNSEELWNKRMDNLTKVPKFRPGDRIVMYGFEGVPLTIQRIEGDKYICADDYGREVPIQISVQGSFTTI